MILLTGTYILVEVVGALASLTGLAELGFWFRGSGVVPATLSQLQGLQSLEFHQVTPCVLEAGCLNLPKLMSLDFMGCTFAEDAKVLPGVTALQRLSRIVFTGDWESGFFDPGLVQLPRLQHLQITQDDELYDDDRDNASRLLRLPADMGLLRLSVLYLHLSGLRLAHFPLAVTQLVALTCLDASMNEFATLPAGITALSRLTELILRRVESPNDPLQLHEKRALNVVAMGDLSGFPALRKLTFACCEVKLCMSLPGGVVGHTSLASIFFNSAHPAPECALMVLQLSQELRRLRRGSLLKLEHYSEPENRWADRALRRAQSLPPFHRFKAAMEWYAL